MCATWHTIQRLPVQNIQLYAHSINYHHATGFKLVSTVQSKEKIRN